MYKQSADKLYVELIETYGEWLEMGHPLEDILLSLLVKERMKTEWLDHKLKENSRLV
jgi:hypothetical protein